MLEEIICFKTCVCCLTLNVGVMCFSPLGGCTNSHSKNFQLQNLFISLVLLSSN